MRQRPSDQKDAEISSRLPMSESGDKAADSHVLAPHRFNATIPLALANVTFPTRYLKNLKLMHVENEKQ